MASRKEGSGAIITGVICLIAYLMGVVLSPHLVPIDFLSSKLQPPKNDAATASAPSKSSTANAPTPSTPPNQLPKTKSGTKEKKIHARSQHEPDYRKIVNFKYDNGSGESVDPFYGVDIVLHRNGESDPCDRHVITAEESENPTELSATSRAILRAADAWRKPLDMYKKYDVDAALTHALAVSWKKGDGNEPILAESGNTCGPTWKSKNHYLDSAPHLKDSIGSLSQMIKFCDMGVDKTPIQLDHNQLVIVPDIGSKPCHFHTREGVRISSLEQLAQLAREAKMPSLEEGTCTEEERNNDGTCTNKDTGAIEGRRELHLYAVQAGRVFIFAPKYVGEIFELPHVEVASGLPVWLEVISLQPRVFDIFNFFDRDESAAIVDKALKETSESHRIKRSSTGASGYNLNSQRTSENGFDTHGAQAQAVKKRCMHVLGFDTYEESLTDGLQVLRYNKTTAYIPHMDWIDDYQKQQEHDFDSEHLGSNRFATILLYMSDLKPGDGGETVFSHGWPPHLAEEDRIQFKDALASLRESGDVGGVLKQDSWEEKMVARCRSRLAIRPHSSRAVLFYSQNPDGTPDKNSMHGGCPVIHGEKWAANLWVWNAPRGGFPGSPVNQHVVDKNRAEGKSVDTGEKKASFTNTNTDERMRNAQLYFQETFWGKLGFGDPALNVNTYEGHQWNVKVGDKTLKTFVIDKRKQQTYTI